MELNLAGATKALPSSVPFPSTALANIELQGCSGAAGKRRAPGQEGPAGAEEEEEEFLFLVLPKMSLY